MIRLALIGTGNLGRIHAGCIANIPEAQFVAYADINQESAQNCLEEFGGEYATTDTERIFNDDSIQAVYICTRHDSHASLAIAAARAGKHILIEKPLALNAEDCETINTEVERAGVFLMPAFKMRYYPLIAKAREFIPNPQVLVGQMMDTRWADNMWAQDPIQGGANVHSQGCHTTDVLRFLAGSEPKKLWAVGGAMTHPGHECIDQCVASIQFENGAIASWIQGDAGTPPYVSKFFIEIFGEGKNVQLYNRFKTATFSENGESWVEQRDEEEGFQIENQEFINALRENRPPNITAQDGIQATRIVLAADRAIRTGEVQTL